MDNIKIKDADLLTSKQVSKSLCITLRTVQRLSKEGKIKSIKVGNQWRYLKEDVEKYVRFGTDFSKEPTRRPNSPTERRIYPRINCFMPCNIKVIIPQKKLVSTTARILNISEGGLFFENFNKEEEFLDIRPDDPINLRFELNENYILKVDGRVVRMQNRGIAVKFRNIYEDVRRSIAKYVG